MGKTAKNIGLDFVICLLSCIIAFISKALTDQLLEIEGSNSVNIHSFYIGAFIFLAPCAIEGIEFITNKPNTKNKVDIFELVFSVIGIILTAYLLYEIIIQKNLICVKLIKLLLFIYPLKFTVHVIDDFLLLTKKRK